MQSKESDAFTNTYHNHLLQFEHQKKETIRKSIIQVLKEILSKQVHWSVAMVTLMHGGLDSW